MLAAAIKSKAKLIVTFNLSDFPKDELAQHGIEAWHPDTFVCHLLDLDLDQVCAATRQHRAALNNPPKTIQEYLAERERDGLIGTVSRLRKYESLL